MCLALIFCRFDLVDLVFLLWRRSIKTPNISNNVHEAVLMKQYYFVFGMMSNQKCARQYLMCMAFGYQTMHFVPTKGAGEWVSEWNELAIRIEFLFCIYIIYKFLVQNLIRWNFQYPRHTCIHVGSTKMRDIQWMWFRFFCSRLKKICPFFHFFYFI